MDFFSRYMRTLRQPRKRRTIDVEREAASQHELTPTISEALSVGNESPQVGNTSSTKQDPTELWALLSQEMNRHDRDIFHGWNDHMVIRMIFDSLLLGMLSTWIVEASKALEWNHSNTIPPISVARIAYKLDKAFLGDANMSYLPNPRIDKLRTFGLAGLHALYSSFTQATLALKGSSLASIWLREYFALTSGSHHDRVRLRQHRITGVYSSLTFVFLKQQHLLMENAALGGIFGGLGFVFMINVWMGIAALVPLLVGAAIGIILIAVPAVDNNSPFRNPFATMMCSILFDLKSVVTKYKPASLKPTDGEQSIGTRTSHIATPLLISLAKKLKKTIEREARGEVKWEYNAAKSEREKEHLELSALQRLSGLTSDPVAIAAIIRWITTIKARNKAPDLLQGIKAAVANHPVTFAPIAGPLLSLLDLPKCRIGVRDSLRLMYSTEEGAKHVLVALVERVLLQNSDFTPIVFPDSFSFTSIELSTVVETMLQLVIPEQSDEDDSSAEPSSSTSSHPPNLHLLVKLAQDSMSSGKLFFVNLALAILYSIPRFPLGSDQDSVTEEFVDLLQLWFSTTDWSYEAPGLYLRCARAATLGMRDGQKDIFKAMLEGIRIERGDDDPVEGEMKVFRHLKQLSSCDSAQTLP